MARSERKGIFFSSKKLSVHDDFKKRGQGRLGVQTVAHSTPLISARVVISGS